MKRFWGVLTAALFIASGAGFAKDIYVSAGANGSGSKESPYGEIQFALNDAYAGDVIHVTEGVYYGEGEGGLWMIKKNQLTLVGGYKKDWSDRDPFKYQSILLRGSEEGSLAECKKRGHEKWHSLTATKASYNGNAMIRGSGEPREDCSMTVIDGFVIDGHTRNTYKKDGDLKIDIGPVGSPLIDFHKPGCKILNCVVVNSAGPGIRLLASGTKDKPETWSEVSNCIIVNTLMEAVEFRVGDYDPVNAPEGGYGAVRNSTIAFVWQHLGEGYGLIIGRQTKLTVENNLFTFSSDVAMNNGFQNEYCRLINNVFWNNMGGVYKYWSPNSKLTLIEDDAAKLEGKNAKKSYSLSDKSQKNRSMDPQLAPVDKDFFDRFSGQVKASGGGKVEWDSVNQWRSAMGLPLIGSTGEGAKNFAPVYDLPYAVLLAKADTGASGAKDAAPFPVYASKAAAAEKTYTDVTAADFLSDSSVSLAGKNVRLKIKLGEREMAQFYVADVTKEKNIAFKIGTFPNSAFLYVPNGTEALETMNEAQKKKIEVIVEGTAFDISAGYKKPRVALVVDNAETDDD